MELSKLQPYLVPPLISPLLLLQCKRHPSLFLQRIPPVLKNSCPPSCQLRKELKPSPYLKKKNSLGPPHHCSSCHLGYLRFFWRLSVLITTPFTPSLVLQWASAPIISWKQVSPRATAASLLPHLSAASRFLPPLTSQWHFTLWTSSLLPATLSFLSFQNAKPYWFDSFSLETSESHLWTPLSVSIP